MPSITEKQLAQLSKASQTSASASSAIFSKWANRPVEVRMDAVQVIPFHELIPRSEPLAPVSFGLALELSGDMGGSLLFLVEESAGYALIDLLMKKPKGTTLKLDPMGRSALQETGNIVGSSYVNALVRELGLDRLVPGPPSLFLDITQSILETVVMQYAATQEELLFIPVHFSSAESGLDWKFFFLPDFAGLSRLAAKA
jgi:chemotaxis protein CheC